MQKVGMHLLELDTGLADRAVLRALLIGIDMKTIKHVWHQYGSDQDLEQGTKQSKNKSKNQNEKHEREEITDKQEGNNKQNEGHEENGEAKNNVDDRGLGPAIRGDYRHVFVYEWSKKEARVALAESLKAAKQAHTDNEVEATSHLVPTGRYQLTFTEMQTLVAYFNL